VRVLFLKYWHNWSLRVTEQQVQNDLRVKQFARYALHEFAPDYTTIFRFEKWVSEQCPRAYFDLILKQVDEQFPNQRRQVQKGDTFAMIANAARESLVTLIRHSSQRLLRAIAEQKGWAYEQLEVLVGQAKLTGEEEKSYYRMTAEERAEQLHTAVSTAYASLDLQGLKPSESVQEWVGHLEKLLADNLYITWQADGQLGEVTRLPSKKQGSYRMGSATDPDATYRKHDDQDDLGYNVSVITNGEFVREIQADTGATPDAVPLPQLLQNQLEHHDLAPEKIVYDQAAGSGKNMAEVHQATNGQTQLVVKPRQMKKQGKLFGPRDFILDSGSYKLTCPNGVTSQIAYRSGSGDGWNYRFAAEQCADCPLRLHCRAKPEAETIRQVFITDYRTFEEKAWAYTLTESFKEEMRARSGVERIIAGLVRYCGARQARGRGLGRADFQAKMSGAVFNAKRLIRKHLLREQQARKEAEEARTRGGVCLVAA
jgi:IS5 family transposase